MGNSAITVGRARRFVADMTSNQVDSTANRVLGRILQDALCRLEEVQDWKFLRLRERVVLDNQVDGTGLSITQNDSTMTLSAAAVPGAWRKKYAEEDWDLLINGDGTRLFNVGEIVSAKVARMRAGQAWSEASVTDATYSLRRSVYELQHEHKEIHQIALLRENIPLQRTSRGEYERYRRLFQQTAEQPWAFTSLDSKSLAVWPPASSSATYQAEVDYTRKLKLPEDDTSDEELLDWPRDMERLLRLAIKVEIADTIRGDHLLFDVNRALMDWRQAIASNKENDNMRARSAVRRMRISGNRGIGIRGADPIFGHALNGEITS